MTRTALTVSLMLSVAWAAAQEPKAPDPKIAERWRMIAWQSTRQPDA